MTVSYFDPESFDLECEVPGTHLELSIRRLWEYAFLGQVNVTECLVSRKNYSSQVINYIDVYNTSSGVRSYVCNLEDLEQVIANMQAGASQTLLHTDKTLFNLKSLKFLLKTKQVTTISKFLASAEDFMYGLSKRSAIRGDPTGFIPPQIGRAGPFYLPGLHSKLEQCLRRVYSTRQTASNWINYFKNLSGRGLRMDEIEQSGLSDWLLRQQTSSPWIRWSAQDLIEAINWSHIRLSVIPVVHLVQKSLELETVTPDTILGLKDKRRAQDGQRRFTTAYDRALGYRIERIEHDTLWGPETHWQAITHDGIPIMNRRGSSLLSSQEVASRLASHHAQRWLPKREAAELWKDYAWPGGTDYQEWIVTLPWYKESTIDNHFGICNVLAHIRCDQRLDHHGQRILLLHEIQSDWVQQWSSFRRDNSNGYETTEHLTPIPEPPFYKDWTSLVLKLMLLHAVWWKYDGLAWTTGSQQFERFKAAEQWLNTLYDRRLPKDAEKILAPIGIKTTTLTLICESDDSSEKKQDDVTNERIKVHGILFDEDSKATIERDGFSAWG